MRFELNAQLAVQVLLKVLWKCFKAQKLKFVCRR